MNFLCIYLGEKKGGGVVTLQFVIITQFVINYKLR